MSLTDAEKRERLSKAMGAAFLSHQVEQLERSVDSLAFSRDARLYNNTDRSNGRQHKHNSRTSRSSATSAQNPTQARPAGAKERRVIDASALVHALPVIKRWVRQDTYQLIVPLQALSTLDILKKAPNPLHDLARDATRFLETQFNIVRQIESTLGSVEANARVRLRAQAAHEELPWARVESLFEVPSGFEVHQALSESTAHDENDAETEPEPPRVPLPGDIPKSLRSVLQCALYFSSTTTTSVGPALPAATVVYNINNNLPNVNPYAAPPQTNATNERRATSTSSRRDNEQSPTINTIDFDSIASGDALTFWLSTFFTSVVDEAGFQGANVDVIGAREVEDARLWLKRLAGDRQKDQAGETQERSGGVGGGRGGNKPSRRKNKATGTLSGSNNHKTSHEPDAAKPGSNMTSSTTRASNPHGGKTLFVP